MTLFEETSFYITLIIEAFKDIKEFLLILATILCSFANASIVVDYNTASLAKYTQNKDKNIEAHEELTFGRFKNEFFDSLFTQWLLGLGEFEMLENTDDSEVNL